VEDANFGDDYTISMSSGPSYISVDSPSRQLIFDLEKVTEKDQGPRQITIVLVDVAQAKTSYSFSYTLNFEVAIDFETPNITVDE